MYTCVCMYVCEYIYIYIYIILPCSAAASRRVETCGRSTHTAGLPQVRTDRVRLDARRYYNFELRHVSDIPIWKHGARLSGSEADS